MAARLKQVAQETVAKLFGLHSALTKTQTEIQRAYTGLGAEFGQPITAANITFALKREPVAHRIVFAVAHDIFDNWFEVEPLQQEAEKRGRWMSRSLMSLCRRFSCCLTPKIYLRRLPFSRGPTAGQSLSWATRIEAPR